MGSIFSQDGVAEGVEGAAGDFTTTAVQQLGARSNICCAALRVKVNRRIADGGTPASTNRATR